MTEPILQPNTIPLQIQITYWLGIFFVSIPEIKEKLLLRDYSE
jgi:hypothetical protein